MIQEATTTDNPLLVFVEPIYKVMQSARRETCGFWSAENLKRIAADARISGYKQRIKLGRSNSARGRK